MKPKDRPPKPKTSVVHVRLTDAELKLLDQIAASMKLTRSELIREWIRCEQ
jgi:metal-responsive CopG/Arc/MetJ family transcriptional regulator